MTQRETIGSLFNQFFDSYDCQEKGFDEYALEFFKLLNSLFNFLTQKDERELISELKRELPVLARTIKELKQNQSHDPKVLKENRKAVAIKIEKFRDDKEFQNIINTYTTKIVGKVAPVQMGPEDRGKNRDATVVKIKEDRTASREYDETLEKSSIARIPYENDVEGMASALSRDLRRILDNSDNLKADKEKIQDLLIAINQNLEQFKQAKWDVRNTNSDADKEKALTAEKQLKRNFFTAEELTEKHSGDKVIAIKDYRKDFSKQSDESQSPRSHSGSKAMDDYIEQYMKTNPDASFDDVLADVAALRATYRQAKKRTKPDRDDNWRNRGRG